MNYKEDILTICKGAIIGGTMSVPGVSGGSMAMILGIYDKLIFSVSNCFKEPKKNILYLMKAAIGGLIGLVLFARLISGLLDSYPFVMRCFFLGAVLGGVPIIFRNIRVEKSGVDIKFFFFIALGILSVFLISLLPTEIFKVSSQMSISYILLQLLAGLIIAVALVLPGISTSHMLLMLGLYDTVLSAAKSLRLVELLPLLAGTLIGIFLTAKLLDRLFEKLKAATYLVVFGFMIGSVKTLLPQTFKPDLMIFGIIAFLAGFVAIYFISKVDKHNLD